VSLKDHVDHPLHPLSYSRS